MSQNKGRFRSLSPGNDAIDVDNYVEFLHTVTTNKETNTDFGNIALTGDIGIGKSSIVRTYEKKYNYKFVYITAGDLGYRFEKDEITSLPILPKEKSECSTDENAKGNPTEAEYNQKQEKNATDKPNDTSDDDREKLIEEIQQKLEKNLLEQLIALCKNKDIPQSRFQTVPENESAIFWKIIYPIFCGVAAFCGFKLIANKFINYNQVNIDFVPWTWFVLIIFISLSIGFAVRKLITHYKFTKLSLNVGKEDTGSASAEIDIDEGENASLDTNLHEIIYLFEQLAKKKRLFKCRKPVFVIEDVDRYPAEICFPILTKFKQINNMLNSRYRLNHSGYGKHYKFIYTLNDKIFDDSQGNRCISDNDPYKFFDVIIPVIPKLSFANSLSILKSDFKDYNIDEEFLKDVSFYIFDFRKLRDIQNEFEVYYDKFKDELNKTQTNSAESAENKKNAFTTTVLLAFVMYKIFYKSKYYELFKTDKNGVPQSKLLKKVLYGSTETVTDGKLEKLLVSRFEAWLGTILNMSDFVEKSYLENMVKSGERKNWSCCKLYDLDLSMSNLNGYNFMCAKFSKTNLEKANLKGADLTSIIYDNTTKWKHARYNFKTRFPCAFQPKEHKMILDLCGEDLKNMNLKGRDLSGALLHGTNLKKVIYDETTIWTGAVYDDETVFPYDFNREEHNLSYLF